MSEQSNNIDSFCKKVQSIKKAWSKKEDKQLQKGIEQCGMNWINIAEYVLDRNPNQCAQRWKRLNGRRSRINKYWKKSEDEQLINLVQKFGLKWSNIAQIMQVRNGKQCRDRYTNVLDPNLKMNSFSQEEDELIYEQYLQQGSKWSYISKQLQGRSPNQIKNRFYGHIRTNYLQIENPYYSKQTSFKSKQILQKIREEHLRKMDNLYTQQFNSDQNSSANLDSFLFQNLPQNFNSNINFKDPSMILENQFEQNN
ncbi:unnamed protein product [Paramecium sonneborni]|uniref:Myb-like DNA-binding domain protein n=1 Tax=Paramecium sonneborni TaxID=65129 RepID=A0A8S1LR35_9CILI|nr:unnamed protein product [Paramecium sonneborni]